VRFFPIKQIVINCTLYQKCSKVGYFVCHRIFQNPPICISKSEKRKGKMDGFWIAEVLDWFERRRVWVQTGALTGGATGASPLIFSFVAPVVAPLLAEPARRLDGLPTHPIADRISAIRDRSVCSNKVSATTSLDRNRIFGRARTDISTCVDRIDA